MNRSRKAIARRTSRLGFALAGPRHYPDGLVPDHWMGDGRADLGSADLSAALRLYLVAGALIAGLLAVAWLAG